MPSLGVIRCRIANEAYCFEMSSVAGVRQAVTLLRPAISTPGQPIGWIPTSGANDIPVFRLSELLGRAESLADIRRQHIVILKTSLGVQGLLVDSVSRVLTISSDQVRPCPELLNDSTRRLFKSVVLFREEGAGSTLNLLLSPERLNSQAPQISADAKLPELRSDANAPSRNSTVVGRIVLFPLSNDRVDGQQLMCGLSATQVVEVLEPLPIVSVPFAPRHVTGFVKWRERAVPVIQLGERLGVSDSLTQSRLVIARQGDDLLGFTASGPMKQKRLPLPYEPCPIPSEFDSEAVLGTYRHDSELVVVPNLGRITQPGNMFSQPATLGL